MSPGQRKNRRFDTAAATFDDADFVHAETRQGLFERLDGVTVEAATVVDLGAATGSAIAGLSRRFRRARVVAVDVSSGMLRAARRKKSWFAKTDFVQAEAVALPFDDASIDVVFANQLLPFFDDPTPVFAETARVLRVGGLFAFATLGPDSLREIGKAWQGIDSHRHVARFADMHNIGDGLVRAGFADPVLDVDRLEVRYRDERQLFADLTAVGARNSAPGRPPGLTGRRRFAAMIDALTANGEIRLDLELVYGHAWGSGPRQDPGRWTIEPGAIGIRRR